MDKPSLASTQSGKPLHPQRNSSESKATDAAGLLPLLGVLLLLPPMISLFNRQASVFGFPIIVVYLFSLWAVLIGGAIWLARRLPRQNG